MDFIKEINSRNELMKILNTAVDRIYKNDKNTRTINTIESNDFDYIGSIFTQYCSNHLTKSEMLDYFPLSSELKDCVLDVAESRKLHICKHLMNQNNSKIIPLCVSFDWDIAIIIGNSSLSSHRQDIARLSIECEHKNKSESLLIEMNLDMIEKMIKKLENVLNE